MVCPQCGAEVPSDDAFCGKCGYAMREGAPERIDQSRIRVHEEPDPLESSPSAPSERRIRQATMVGMPAVTPSKSPSPPTAPEVPAPPAEISAARERAKTRTPKKTMLGMQRPDLAPPPAPVPPSPDPNPPASDEAADDSERPPRERAHVRYDSMHEAFPALERRKKALRGLAVLVVVAGAWFAYRFFTLNG